MDSCLQDTLIRAWNAFAHVIQSFLGNKKTDKYNSLKKYQLKDIIFLKNLILILKCDVIGKNELHSVSRTLNYPKPIVNLHARNMLLISRPTIS